MSCFLSLNTHTHTQPDAPVERWITLSPVTRNGRHTRSVERGDKKEDGREVAGGDDVVVLCCVGTRRAHLQA